MGLTLPYGQNHYMGEYATEGAALTWIQGNKWDTDGDGTGNPKAGMAFFDTAATKIKVHDGSAWVALGSAAPAGSTTQVQFNSAGVFGADANLVWDNGNKRLGIGTTAPAVPLDIVQSSSLWEMLQVRQYSTTTYPCAVLVRGRGTDASPAVVQSGDTLGGFLLGGQYNTGTSNYERSCGMYGTASETHSATARGTYLSFWTTPNTTTAIAERLRIASDGKVGIANTSPSALLTLGTAGTTAGTISLAGGTSGVVTVQTAAAAGTWSLTLPTTGGTNGYFLQTNGSGVTTWAAVAATPAGSSTQIQYNSGGAFAATDKFTYSGSQVTLSGDSVLAYLFLNSYGTGYQASTWLARANGTMATPTAALSGEALGLHGWRAWDGSGWGNAAFISASAEGNFTTGYHQANLHIYMMNGINQVERIRILSSGWIGINRSGAVESIDTTGAIRIGNATNANAGTIRWNGTNFAGHNGTTWVNLDASGGTPAGSTGYVQFNNAGAFAADAGLFWDNTNKRLGIGTTAPVYKFHVAADAASELANIVASATAGTAGTVLVGHTGGTTASPTATQSGYTLGSFVFSGRGASGPLYPAFIQAFANQTFTNSAQGAYLTFTTSPNNTVTPLERMRITSDGQLYVSNAMASAANINNNDIAIAKDQGYAGFGAQSFGTGYYSYFSGMHANGSLATRTAAVSGDVLSSFAGLGFGATTWQPSGWMMIVAEATFTDSSSPAYLKFGTTPSASTTITERMRITSAGQVHVSNDFSNFSSLPSAGFNVSFVGGNSGITNQAYGTGTIPYVDAMRARGTNLSKVAVASGDVLGQFSASGYGASAWSGGGGIRFLAAETFTNTSGATDFTVGLTPAGATAWTERMRVTSAGNVFIGTTAGVSVSGTTQTHTLMVYGTDSSPQFNGIISEGGACPGRFNGHRHNGPYGTKTAVATTQNLLGINAFGWDGGTSPTYVSAAAITFTVDGTVAEDSVPGSIIFYTREVGNTVSPYQRMVITNIGRVGIANNAPTALLTIGTNATVGGAIDLLGATSGTCAIRVAAAAGTTTFQLPATNGTSGYFLQTNGSGVTTWAAVTASAAGSNTQVQYNNAGALGASSGFTFDSTNRVVDLAGDAVNPGLRVTAAGTSAFPFLTLRRYRNTVASPQAVQSGDVLGQIAFVGYGTTGAYTGAQFVGYADGTWTDSSAPAYLLFRTTPSGTTTPVERMRITSAGLVGIANTSPGALLTLGTAGTTAGTLSLAGGTSGVVTVQTAATAGTWSMTLPTSGGTSGYFLQTNGSGVTTWAAASGGTTVNAGTAQGQVLFWNSGGSAWTYTETSEWVWDDTNKRVGIGCTTPTTLLTLGTAGSTAGKITLAGATSGTCVIQVAAAAGTGTIFQLPATNGTNGYFLKTDGSGLTSWAVATTTALDAGTAAGQVAFWDHGNTKWTYAETSEWVWDDTNKRVGINVASPSSRLDVGGDVEISSDAWHYYGDPTTDGSWRTGRVSADLVVQKRESGTWTTKHTFV